MGNIPASGGGGGAAVWGDITGTLANQTDLETSLSSKAVSPLTTKGDLWGFQTLKGIPGDARVPIGSNGQVLTADSTQDLGLHWSTPSSGVTSVSGTANQIASTGGTTPVLSLPSNLILPDGATATTQAASDNSTKVATTAYADAGVAAVPSPPYLLLGANKYGPASQLVQPPALASWTWVNQNGASANTTNGFLSLTSPLTTGDNFNLLVLAAPATPWTKTAFINFVYLSFVGLVFRQSSDGKIAVFGFGDNSGATTIASIKYNSPTSFSATYTAQNQHVISGPGGVWLRVADNGTSRICSYSLDGINWVAFHTVGRTDFLTADQVGIAVNANSSSFASILNLLSWA